MCRPAGAWVSWLAYPPLQLAALPLRLRGGLGYSAPLALKERQAMGLHPTNRVRLLQTYPNLPGVPEIR